MNNTHQTSLARSLSLTVFFCLFLSLLRLLSLSLSRSRWLSLCRLYCVQPWHIKLVAQYLFLLFLVSVCVLPCVTGQPNEMITEPGAFHNAPRPNTTFTAWLCHTVQSMPEHLIADADELKIVNIGDRRYTTSQIWALVFEWLTIRKCVILRPFFLLLVICLDQQEEHCFCHVITAAPFSRSN